MARRHGPASRRPGGEGAPAAPTRELEISTEKVCYVILRARELEAKVEVDDPDSGSNPSDDMAVDVLEDTPDDPTRLELREFLDSLNEDEQVHLVALAWLGRGDFGIEGWDEAVAEAARAHTEHTAGYLLGMPMLADYLEQGLAAHGLDCAEYEAGRL